MLHFVVQYEKSAELATVDMGAPIETFDDGNLVPNGQLLFVTGMKVYTRRWSQALVVGGMLQSSYTLELKRRSLLKYLQVNFREQSCAKFVSVVFKLSSHLVVVRLH